MAWPLRTWAATTALGVYYTMDSLDPAAAQPTWVAVNDGLSNTDIRSFCLDRHETVPDSRMFCIDNTTKTVWRRTGGNWSSVLTSADARAIAGFTHGETLTSVIVDDVTGYVYALLNNAAASGSADKGVMRSVDNGTTWTAVTQGAYENSYYYSNIDAYNGLVVYSKQYGAVSAREWYSTDHGATWSVVNMLGMTSAPKCTRIHHAAGDTWYGSWFAVGAAYDLLRGNTGGVISQMMATQVNGPQVTAGGIWPDPVDANHLLIAARQITVHIIESVDAGVSASSDTIVSVQYMYEIADGCEYDYWVQGCVSPYAIGARAIVYASPDAVTLTNKSGSNWNTPPYTDAIPVTCGGVTQRGLWVVPEGPPVPPVPTVPPVPPFRPHSGQHGISMSVFKPRITIAP